MYKNEMRLNKKNGISTESLGSLNGGISVIKRINRDK